jgi:hypothetical protein
MPADLDFIGRGLPGGWKRAESRGALWPSFSSQASALLLGLLPGNELPAFLDLPRVNQPENVVIAGNIR